MVREPVKSKTGLEQLKENDNDLFSFLEKEGESAFTDDISDITTDVAIKTKAKKKVVITCDETIDTKFLEHYSLGPDSSQGSLSDDIDDFAYLTQKILE